MGRLPQQQHLHQHQQHSYHQQQQQQQMLHPHPSSASPPPQPGTAPPTAGGAPPSLEEMIAAAKAAATIAENMQEMVRWQLMQHQLHQLEIKQQEIKQKQLEQENHPLLRHIVSSRAGSNANHMALLGGSGGPGVMGGMPSSQHPEMILTRESPLYPSFQQQQQQPSIMHPQLDSLDHPLSLLNRLHPTQPSGSEILSHMGMSLAPLTASTLDDHTITSSAALISSLTAYPGSPPLHQDLTFLPPPSLSAFSTSSSYGRSTASSAEPSSRAASASKSPSMAAMLSDEDLELLSDHLLDSTMYAADTDDSATPGMPIDTVEAPSMGFRGVEEAKEELPGSVFSSPDMLKLKEGSEPPTAGRAKEEDGTLHRINGGPDDAPPAVIKKKRGRPPLKNPGEKGKRGKAGSTANVAVAVAAVMAANSARGKADEPRPLAMAQQAPASLFNLAPTLSPLRPSQTISLLSQPPPNNTSQQQQPTRPKHVRKVAHNAIERRYRNNINQRISDLKSVVPALNVPRSKASLASSSKKRSKEDDSDDDDTAAADDRDNLVDGIPAATKSNKATILRKATEYILHLKAEVENAKEEARRLRDIVEGRRGLLSPVSPYGLGVAMAAEPFSTMSASDAEANRLSPTSPPAGYASTVVGGVRMMAVLFMTAGILYVPDPFSGVASAETSSGSGMVVDALGARNGSDVVDAVNGRAAGVSTVSWISGGSDGWIVKTGGVWGADLLGTVAVNGVLGLWIAFKITLFAIGLFSILRIVFMIHQPKHRPSTAPQTRLTILTDRLALLSPSWRSSSSSTITTVVWTLWEALRVAVNFGGGAGGWVDALGRLGAPFLGTEGPEGRVMDAAEISRAAVEVLDLELANPSTDPLYRLRLSLFLLAESSLASSPSRILPTQLSPASLARIYLTSSLGIHTALSTLSGGNDRHFLKVLLEPLALTVWSLGCRMARHVEGAKDVEGRAVLWISRESSKEDGEILRYASTSLSRCCGEVDIGAMDVVSRRHRFNTLSQTVLRSIFDVSCPPLFALPTGSRYTVSTIPILRILADHLRTAEMFRDPLAKWCSASFAVMAAWAGVDADGSDPTVKRALLAATSVFLELDGAISKTLLADGGSQHPALFVASLAMNYGIIQRDVGGDAADKVLECILEKVGDNMKGYEEGYVGLVVSLVEFCALSWVLRSGEMKVGRDVVVRMRMMLPRFSERTWEGIGSDGKEVKVAVGRMVDCVRAWTDELISVFDERELELLIGGLAEMDVDDWKKHTDYRGYTENDEVVQWFWKYVKQLEAEKKANLLQFVTGTSRISVNGFKDLQGSDGPRRFTIEKTGELEQLPKSHTCFNRLELPPYKFYEKLAEKLTLAVEEGMGFGVE
ncbi:hypothetical protein HDU67_001653 [Dinochytrium kinnereticum]|nr:hypothetical protein HDU67_001653 [Dinochytrium kinnereticum]